MTVITVIIIIEKKTKLLLHPSKKEIEGGEQKEAFSINLYICALLVTRFSSCSSFHYMLLLTSTPPLLLVTLLFNYYNIYSLYMFKVQTK